jgi:hypothetical protein
MNNNVIRRISELSLPRTQRSIAHATTRNFYTRSTLPIGLAVTRVGAPTAPKQTPVVSRSRATAKTPNLRYSADIIDRYAPQAYKNNTWKYYVSPSWNRVIFFNTKNGVPFTFKKNGQRTNVSEGYFARVGMGLDALRRSARQRKRYFHTFDAYQKRLNQHVRTVRGTRARANMMVRIGTHVLQYIGGNNSALNDIPFSQLVYWANRTPWMMAGHGRPYVKHGEKWFRYGSNVQITKNNILRNIRNTWNYSQN